MTQAQTMNTSRGCELLMLSLLALMFAGAAWCWSSAPEKIPVHWNLQGEVDRYGGKFEGLLLMPLITAGLYLLLKFIPAIDPKKENFAQFAKAYLGIRIGLSILMAVIQLAILATVMGYQTNMNVIVGGSVGCLFILIGNVMGKIRPNWCVGVRTPWTLSSKTSWVKTHRLSGWIFIASGIAILITGFMESKYALVVTLVTAIGGSVWLILYSYLVWKNDTNRVSALDTSPGDEAGLNSQLDN